jgi:hypothetical protein
MRYYLHGDPIENLQGMFYCWPCESFEPKDHFASCELGKVFRKGEWVEDTHHARYERQRKMVINDVQISSIWSIVDDANNLFRLPPVGVVDDRLGNEFVEMERK